MPPVGQGFVKPYAGVFTPTAGKKFGGIEIGTVSSPFWIKKLPAFRENCKVSLLWGSSNGVLYKDTPLFEDRMPLAMWSLPNQQGYLAVSGEALFLPEGSSYGLNMDHDIDKVYGSDFNGIQFDAPEQATSSTSTCSQQPLCGQDSYEDENGVCKKAAVKTYVFKGTHDKNQWTIAKLGQFKVDALVLGLKVEAISLKNHCLDIELVGTSYASSPLELSYAFGDSAESKRYWKPAIEETGSMGINHESIDRMSNPTWHDSIKRQGTVEVNAVSGEGYPFEGPSLPRNWDPECKVASVAELKVQIFSKQPK